MRPERRDLIVAEIRAALAGAIPGSGTQLRGSLATGTADSYSDIDICWSVPDDRFAAAVDSAATAIGSVGELTSLRVDPDLARSDLRRLIFARLANAPLFWRIDLDIRAASIATDDDYDAANPAARSEAEWSRPASAMENAVAAIKGAARGQMTAVAGLLDRGYERIGLVQPDDADLRARITRLADACAILEPALAGIAARVHELAMATDDHPR